MTIKSLRIAAGLAFTLFSATAFADISDNDNRQSACATLELMAKMTAINLILPANHDNLATLQETQNHLIAMNQLACQSVHFNEEIQFENRYSNGVLISRDLAQAPWYFPNGQLFIERPGSRGAAIEIGALRSTMTPRRAQLSAALTAKSSTSTTSGSLVTARSARGQPAVIDR